MAIGLFRKLSRWMLIPSVERKNVEETTSHPYRPLILLLREMIDMAYVYECDREKFYYKFLEKISVESLRERGIIDPEAVSRQPRYNLMCGRLKREDAELWALMEIGFTARELTIIYGHTNSGSIYVKVARLRKRLYRKRQELMDNG